MRLEVSETQQESTELIEAAAFQMGPDGPMVNAWGRPHDEDVTFDDGANDNYDQMKVPELKDELKTRLDAGRDIDTSGITKKSQLVAALREDDQAQAREATAGEGDEDTEE
jgi:hypothetical protein